VNDLVFLIVGSFAAVGAALAVGTLAALVRYRRTGTMPGSDDPVELPRRRLVGMWVRVVVGVVLAVYGIATLDVSGLL
jgi:hypothetical protein